jgi:hypothetical protein
METVSVVMLTVSNQLLTDSNEADKFIGHFDHSGQIVLVDVEPERITFLHFFHSAVES